MLKKSCKPIYLFIICICIGNLLVSCDILGIKDKEAPLEQKSDLETDPLGRTEEECTGTVDSCGICDGSGPTTWYEDKDEDGLGNPSPDTTKISCAKPKGYVTTNIDNNDNSNCPSNTFDSCKVCNGDGTTCKSSEENIDCAGIPNGNAIIDECGICSGLGKSTYYADSDGDELGDPNTSIRSCSQPTNHSNESCLESEENCAKPINYVLNSNDKEPKCKTNDTDECGVCAGPGKITYYADDDGDGLGNLNTTKISCTIPSGYVLNSNDNCNTNIMDICGICNGDNSTCRVSLEVSKETVYEKNIKFIQLGNNIEGDDSNVFNGWSTTLSSDGYTLAIGAIYSNGSNGIDSGQVKVYKWTNHSWDQVGNTVYGEAAHDYSGYSTKLSDDGRILAIGAYSNSENGNESGHVRIYELNGSNWSLRGNDIDGENGDHSGESISLSSDGSIVAIGSHYNDAGNSVNDNRGTTRVFKWNGSAWNQLGNNINGEAASDESGFSVSLSSNGETLAIGAYSNDGNGNMNSGHIRIYSWNGTSWEQKGSDINGEAADDLSGIAIDLDSNGDIIAIGSPYNDGANGGGSGHVRVYEWTGSSWTQRGSDIDGENGNDYSGFTVALSSDGSIISIGAPYNNGGKNNAGHVRVYQWAGSTWIKLGRDIDGETDNEYTGYSNALSSNGSIISIGAPFANNYTGHVKVLKKKQSQLHQ